MGEPGGGKKKKQKARAASGDVVMSPQRLRGKNAWLALAVTLIVPLAVLALARVGLPGIDEAGFDEIFRRSSLLHPGAERPTFGAFSLGIMPFISASIVVELVAFLVPRWNVLRNAGPAGRAKLGRATAWLAVALSAFQAFGITRLLEGLAGDEDMGKVSVPLVMVTLVAGAMLLGILADVATRRGLVSGFMIIYLAGALPDGLRSARELAAQLGGSVLAVTLAGAAVAVGATWWVLRPSKPTEPDNSARPVEPYRAAALDDVARLGVPTLPSGIIPLYVAASLITLPATIASFAAGARPIGDALLGDSRVYIGVSLGLIVVLTALVGWMLAAPGRVAALWRRAGSRIAAPELEAEARARLRHGIIVTILYLVVLFAIDRAVAFSHGAGTIVLMSSMLTAIALDIVDAWKARRRMPDLVAVWPEHRPYAIAVAREVLEANGIPLVVENERYRLLFPISPLVPLDLLVPEPHALRATELLAATLGVAPELEAPPAIRLAARAPLGLARAEWALAGLSALVGGALLAYAFTVGASGHFSSSARGPARPESLQLFAVDNESDFFAPLARSKTELPRCLSFETENVPVGPAKQEMRRYASCKAMGQTTVAGTRAELLAWGRKLELPAGDRFAVGWVDEYNEDTEQTTRTGVRSYLLKPTAIIDGNDVKNAEAVIQSNRGLEGAVVAIELTPTGAAKFAEFTGANVGKVMAIVVDGDVTSAPRILSRISGGHVQITMGAGDIVHQRDQANRLADELMGRAEPAAAPSLPAGR